MRQIPATVTDFPALIAWLLQERHDGVKLGMTKLLKLSSAVATFWLSGMNLPSDENVKRICDAYDLDYWGVMRLVLTSRGLPRFPAAAAAARPSRRAAETTAPSVPPQRRAQGVRSKSLKRKGSSIMTTATGGGGGLPRTRRAAA
jgi:hypothetical protein